MGSQKEEGILALENYHAFGLYTQEPVFLTQTPRGHVAKAPWDLSKVT